MALAAASPLLHLLVRQSSTRGQIFACPLQCRPRNPFPRLRFCVSTSSRDSPSTSYSTTELPREEQVNSVVEVEENKPRVPFSSAKPPILTVKEKKELASYAHSLGKKLKSQQVGKSGVTVSLAASFIENLEANELLKLKVHNSCPGELPDVVRQLEEATGSVAVGQIGRSVILYRPSVTKMQEAERKKQQVQSVRKRVTANPMEPKVQGARTSLRGRRGSSRFSMS
ncbi:hypothetical protein H6P81_018669 [Aristolochia fimbriata]|uniref:CRM domain-containing protein n=1 Tax=Aristolochia fimbriata TaxID=158543 RepID=A0AAV7E1P4_ARIFI|nr:hypothetical protein H6P81_018669 [Aristolochia fimbriata]